LKSKLLLIVLVGYFLINKETPTQHSFFFEFVCQYANTRSETNRIKINVEKDWPNKFLNFFMI